MAAATPAETRRPLRSGTLQALTAAALVLPGLVSAPTARAAAESLDLQYSRYEEGRRDLFNITNTGKPLTVDSLSALGSLEFRNSLQLDLHLTQDTWAGATPVTTAPLAFKGNNPILMNAGQGVVITGASPLVNGTLALNPQLQPLGISSTGATQADPRNVLIMASASPELRQQADATFSREGLAHGISAGVGVSDEADYLSRYGNVRYRRDFNQKLTSLTLGTAYTHSATAALLDQDLLPYLTRSAYQQQLERSPGREVLRGTRSDRNLSVGLTQVVNAQTLLDFNAALTWSSGFMENPYKAMTVVFVPPASGNASVLNGDVRALLEQRPDQRRQTAYSARLVRYIAPLDAALHFSYHYGDDDWGLRAHTLEAQWVQPLGDNWELTPRLRYYSQRAADFYQPLLYSRQSFRAIARDPGGREIWQNPANPDHPYYRDNAGNFTDTGGTAVDATLLNLQPQFTGYDPQLLPAHFSSDHRLGGFGAASAALTLSRRFTAGFSLEAGIEYYRRASAWQAGGSQDNGFADFSFTMANLAIQVDLQATPRRLRRAQGAATRVAAAQNSNEHGAHAATANSHALHAEMATHAAHQLPAGLMFGHLLETAGSVMAGYRSTLQWQTGSMLHGAAPVADARIVAEACGAQLQCRFVPDSMQMTMHMLDLMYAPTAKLTLMLMPQFMTMDMQLRELQGRPPPVPGVHEHSSSGAHVTAALGDTYAGALFRLGLNSGLHAGIGLSIPTGKVNLEYRRMARSDGGLQHFEMQTGSGTWDLVPALTWTTMAGRWQHGVQLSGTKRLEQRNASGYRLGDVMQVTGWTAHNVNEWLGGSLRLAYSDRGSIRGDFDRFNARSGPMDFPVNQGGRYWDLGLGLTLSAAGNEVAVEWLQPLHDQVNGYQLERRGTLSASWRYGF